MRPCPRRGRLLRDRKPVREREGGPIGDLSKKECVAAPFEHISGLGITNQNDRHPNKDDQRPNSILNES